jgi:hypothetical protein
VNSLTNKKEVEVAVETPKTCTKGHKDIEVVYYEKLDHIDTFRQIKPVGVYGLTYKFRNVKVYSGFCVVYCNVCEQEYEMDCTIYEYGKWKEE